MAVIGGGQTAANILGYLISIGKLLIMTTIQKILVVLSYLDTPQLLLFSVFLSLLILWKETVSIFFQILHWHFLN